ncbi:hypothetical protein ACU61A_39215 [Pseudonocardia sichuanensis]
MQEIGHIQPRQRLETHNVSVDDQVAEAHLCGQIHLPTGRTCIGYTGHTGSCRFEAPDRAHEVAQQELRNA